eukprot:jgi/Chlat1/5748/Chrsp38S00431
MAEMEEPTGFDALEDPALPVEQIQEAFARAMVESVESERSPHERSDASSPEPCSPFDSQRSNKQSPATTRRSPRGPMSLAMRAAMQRSATQRAKSPEPLPSPTKPPPVAADVLEVIKGAHTWEPESASPALRSLTAIAALVMEMCKCNGVEQMACILAARLAAALKGDAARVFMFDQASSCLRCIADRNADALASSSSPPPALRDLALDVPPVQINMAKSPTHQAAAKAASFAKHVMVHSGGCVSVSDAARDSRFITLIDGPARALMTIPLEKSGAVVGVLQVRRHRTLSFSKEDEIALACAAAAAGPMLALAWSTLLQLRHKQDKLTSVTRDLAVADCTVNGLLNERSLCKGVPPLAASALHSDAAALYLLDIKAGELCAFPCAATGNVLERTQPSITILGQAMLQRQPVISAKPMSADITRIERVGRELVATLAVPVLTPEKLPPYPETDHDPSIAFGPMLGVLMVVRYKRKQGQKASDTAEPGQYHQEDAHELAGIAKMLAPAIASALRYQAICRSTLRAEAELDEAQKMLAACARATASLSPGIVLATVPQCAAELLHAQKSALYVYDDINKCLSGYAASIHPKEDPRLREHLSIALNEPSMLTACATLNTVMIAHDASAHASYNARVDAATGVQGACLMAPIACPISSSVSAVLVIWEKTEGDFNSHDVERMQKFTPLAYFALRNSIEYVQRCHIVQSGNPHGAMQL